MMNYCGDIGVDKLLKNLFERSVIGSVNPSNNFVKFKHKLSKKMLKTTELTETIA